MFVNGDIVEILKREVLGQPEPVNGPVVTTIQLSSSNAFMPRMNMLKEDVGRHDLTADRPFSILIRPRKKLMRPVRQIDLQHLSHVTF